MGKYLILIASFLFISCSNLETANLIQKEADCYEIKELAMSKNINALMEQNTKFKIFNNLANCLSENKKFNESLYYYEIALTATNISTMQRSLLFSNMANNYILTNSLDLAVTTLEKALSINQDNENALAQLGIINFYNNNYEKSNDYLLKIKRPTKNIGHYISANFFFLNQFPQLNNFILKKADINTDENKLLEGAVLIIQRKKSNEALAELRNLKIESSPFRLIQLYIDKNYGNNKI